MMDEKATFIVPGLGERVPCTIIKWDDIHGRCLIIADGMRAWCNTAFVEREAERPQHNYSAGATL